MLLTSGKTGIIKGFVSQKGEFDAALKVDQENKKIGFEFSNSTKTGKGNKKS